MRKEFLVALALLGTGAGLAHAQGYYPQSYYPQAGYYPQYSYPQYSYPQYSYPQYSYPQYSYPQHRYPAYYAQQYAPAYHAPQSGYGQPYVTTSQPSSTWTPPPPVSVTPQPASPAPSVVVTPEPPVALPATGYPGHAVSSPDSCGPACSGSPCDSGACCAEAPACITPPPKVVGPCFWVSAEYLLWWVDRAPLQPLVTTTSNPASAKAGVLGQPETGVLFGDRDLGFPEFSGGRLTLGAWFNKAHTCGMEVNAFALQERSVLFSTPASRNGLPPVFIPFFDAQQNRPNAFIISNPSGAGILDGSLAIENDLQLWGTEANLLCNLCCKHHCTLDLIAGVRYLDLEENFNLRADLSAPGFPIRDAIRENFNTQNQFLGGQLGARFGWRHGPCGIELLGKVAVGSNHQIVQVSGSDVQTNTTTGAVVVLPGGILTQPTNIGRRTHDEISVVPHFQAKVDCLFCKCLRGWVGYDFIYWSRVVRPGDQIDTTINLSQSAAFGAGSLAGSARPASLLNPTEFFVHGVSVGLEFRY